MMPGNPTAFCYSIHSSTILDNHSTLILFFSNLQLLPPPIDFHSNFTLIYVSWENSHKQKRNSTCFSITSIHNTLSIYSALPAVTVGEVFRFCSKSTSLLFHQFPPITCLSKDIASTIASIPLESSVTSFLNNFYQHSNMLKLLPS